MELCSPIENIARKKLHAMFTTKLTSSLVWGYPGELDLWSLC